jgi:hypothetical protein
MFRVFVVGVASRRGFVIVLSLCEDKTSFPPPLFSLWIWPRVASLLAYYINILQRAMRYGMNQSN